MKAIIEISFIEINKQRVTDGLLEKTPQLPKVTEKTIIKLCKELEQYFQKNRIVTSISQKILV